MKFEFIFSNLPDIKAKTTAKIKTSIQIPDEIVHLIGVEERIREIGKQVGNLTQASLHISCKDLDIKDELMNSKEFGEDTHQFTIYHTCLIVSFSGYRSKRCILRVYKPLDPQKLGVPDTLIRNYGRRGKKRRGKKSLADNLKPLHDSWVKTDEQKTYYGALKIISDQLNILLNADPTSTHLGNWQLAGFHPFWFDDIVQKGLKKERQRLWDLENKPPESHNKKNADKHGKGNRIGAIPGKFMGVQFHSQLEIRLATALQQRGIEWIYEEERLGEGNYLVDFHLPQHKAWVEVKGRFEARDHFLLKEVAEVLENRGEKLYVFTSGKPMIVTPDEFTPIPRKEFWSLIENSAE